LFPKEKAEKTLEVGTKVIAFGRFHQHANEPNDPEYDTIIIGTVARVLTEPSYAGTRYLIKIDDYFTKKGAQLNRKQVILPSNMVAIYTTEFWNALSTLRTTVTELTKTIWLSEKLRQANWERLTENIIIKSKQDMPTHEETHSPTT